MAGLLTLVAYFYPSTLPSVHSGGWGGDFCFDVRYFLEEFG